MTISLQLTKEGYLRTILPHVFIRMVTVHGSIGAGKTTLLEHIQAGGFRVLYEDIASWRNFKGHNLLEEYYRDPSRLSYPFQSEVIRSRYVQLLNLVHDKEWLESYHNKPDTIEFNKDCIIRVVFCERDHESSLNVFAKRLTQGGLMMPLEYDHLKEWCSILQLPSPKYIVFLDTPTTTCVNRMHLRNRKEEQGTVDETLVEDINVMYKKWLEQSDEHVYFVKPYGLDVIDEVCKKVVRYACR
jgi:deoxyadenosine/deoxycytidine kinase